MESTLADRIGDKTILLIGTSMNGLGDLSCTRKVADLFRIAGGIPREQIVIASDDHKKLRLYFDPKEIYRVVSYDTFLRKIKPDTNIALAVVAPSVSLPNAELLIDKFPSLFLGEYELKGKRVKMAEDITATYSLGFKGLGLLMDNKLHQWGFSNNPKTPVQKARRLRKLDDRLWEIIGSGGKLYVGYASKNVSKQAFVKAICRAEEESEEDLVFVLPGSHWLSRNSLKALPGVQKVRYFDRKLSVRKKPDSKPKKTRSCCNQLWSWYNRLRRLLESPKPISEFNKSHQPFSTETRIVKFNQVVPDQVVPDEGKWVTIITGKFQHWELRVLWEASERDVLATGDQSLSEALSANKSPLYEKLSHKNKLAECLVKKYNHDIDICVDPEKNGEDEMAAQMFKAITALRKQGYKETDLGNQRIWSNDLCDDRVIQVAEKLLRDTQNADYPLDLRENELENPAQDIPFNERVWLTNGQICSLKLPVNSLKSKLPELQDSHFEYCPSLYPCWLLKRIKVNNTEEVLTEEELHSTEEVLTKEELHSTEEVPTKEELHSTEEVQVEEKLSKMSEGSSQSVESGYGVYYGLAFCLLAAVGVGYKMGYVKVPKGAQTWVMKKWKSLNKSVTSPFFTSR